MVRYLLDFGAIGRPAIDIAVQKNHLELIELLLSRGGDINDVLESAVSVGSTELVTRFLSRCDANAVDKVCRVIVV